MSRSGADTSLDDVLDALLEISAKMDVMIGQLGAEMERERDQATNGDQPRAPSRNPMDP